MIDAILIYFQMKQIPFKEFYKYLKTAWKNHTIARRKGEWNANHYNWRSLLQYFGEHVSRAYALLGTVERDRIVRFCEKELRSDCGTMKDNLSNYVLVNIKI